MSPGLTRSLLGLALLATVAAAWFAPPSGEDGVALSQHAQTAARQAGNTAPSSTAVLTHEVIQAASAAPVSVLRIRPRTSAEDDQDLGLFALNQWTPPIKAVSVANTAPVVLAPAVSQAPPLPFHLLGRYDEGENVAVFLQYNDQNLVVRVGDTIADQYKVESLKGTTLSLRYLPLNQTQTLEVGGAP